MKNSFGSLVPAGLAVLVLACFAMAPYADAAGGRGGGGGGGGGARASGGGGGGGGGARASGGGGGGGGARQSAQVDNSRADARTNNTRSGSVNNVNNVNVERNVNVSGNNGCCNNGWDNDYHPVATAAAVGAAVAVDFGRRRVDGAHRPAWLRARELRRHRLSAMRRHLVCPAGIAVRRRQSTVLIRASHRPNVSANANGRGKTVIEYQAGDSQWSNIRETPMKFALMIVCAFFASNALAADCVTNSQGKTVCSNGDKAVVVNKNTGTVKSAERNSSGTATTVQSRNGAKAAYNPKTGNAA